jgi:hypothetical protein
MKVFSYCLYGSRPKYVEGMHKNINQISDKFPDSKIIIFYEEGNTDIEPFKKYQNVILKKGEHSGNQMMLDRFVPIDDPDVDIMFVRDADSRINERDEWCIREFINSPKLFHTIRDHPYHTSLIMGGLWGIKKGGLPRYLKMKDMISIYETLKTNKQGFDQYFLSEIIYPKIADKVLIHGQVKLDEKETVIPIPFKSEHIFCGQAIEFDEFGREYHNCDDCRAITTNEATN